MDKVWSDYVLDAPKYYRYQELNIIYIQGARKLKQAYLCFIYFIKAKISLSTFALKQEI